MFVGSQEIAVNPGNLFFVPAGTAHGIVAAEDSRLVVLFIKAPASTSLA
jgi:quercetin dioxygenase-like cupin family protein